VSCFTLLPVSAIAAGPRDGHHPVPGDAPASSNVPPGPPALQGGAGAGCCATPQPSPPQPPPPLASARKHHDPPTASPSGPAPAGSTVQQAGERGAPTEGQHSDSIPLDKRRHGTGAPDRRSGRRTVAAAQQPRAEGGEREAQGAATRPQEALSTPAASRRREKQREKQREKGRHGKGKGKEEKAGGEAPESGSGAPESTHTPAANATGVAHLASAASAQSAAAGATLSTAATPAGGLGELQSTGSAPSRRAPARGRRAPARTPAVSTPALPGGAPQLLATSSLAPAQAIPARTARPRTGASSAKRAPSPLVTTVTHIINVVPPLLRVLIGALVALALALGVSSRLIALRARRLANQRRQLLDDVGLLQGALLPTLPARLGPVGTSAAYRPASGPAAGGDFYDVFALADGQLAVLVGDVSGHGREALPHTTLVRYTLRAYLEAGLSPRGALQAAAPVLERQLAGSFATVVLATYHPRERLLRYACAGHPPPIVIGADAMAPITACSSPPIGAGEPTGMRQSIVSIPGGALLCFFTDGVIEARLGGELFGAARLQRTLAALQPGASASELLDRVCEEADRRPDDMAACLLRIDGEPCAPSVQVEELELDRSEATRNRLERFLLAGGLDPEEIGEVLRSVRAAVARDGGVVLELHLDEGSPRVALRQQNVTRLTAPQPPVGRAAGVSR
jgi:hypothetical protein